MYSQLNQYYLRQMGITPWVTKGSTLNSQALSVSNEQSSAKVHIVMRANASQKAQVFVRRFCSFLQLEPDMIEMICVDESESLELNKTFEDKNPLAIFSLGLNVNELQFNCPVFLNQSPDYLLKNPIEKKKLFTELNELNRLISIIDTAN